MEFRLRQANLAYLRDIRQWSVSIVYGVRKFLSKLGSESLETIHTKHVFLQQGDKSAQPIRKLAQSCLSSKNDTIAIYIIYVYSVTTQCYEKLS